MPAKACDTRDMNGLNPRLRTATSCSRFGLFVLLGLGGCETTDDPPIDNGQDNSTTSTSVDGDATDITDRVFSAQTPSCDAYIGTYVATVHDQETSATLTAHVEITESSGTCTVSSNGIPNHDFNDQGAFATPVAEVNETFQLTAAPADATTTTALSLSYDNGIFLNGVKLDLLAAACYGVGDEPLGQEKIGCMQEDQPWRYDPMFAGNDFGTDGHNAHTQPDGAYHYHGDPEALYDTTGSTASGVIGFAADGYPIFGPYIDDGGTIRRVVSGYTLRSGSRQSQTGEGAFPGGEYDGTYIDDFEFTDAGDLDVCNGMLRNGAYGYYVTDSFPWVMRCFKGTPDGSFQK